MKTILSITSLIFCLTIQVSAQNKKVKTESIHVWGNCNMCKKTIENASDLRGVKVASWNVDSKMLKVSFDTTKITSDQIQLKIAAAGYDTEKYRANDKAYDELHGCCKYERKKD